MEIELNLINDKMKEEINIIKQKYKNIKANIIKKYKTKRIAIPKTVKDKLWDDTFGSKCGEGECYVCLTTINSKQFECGHIIAVARGGDNNITNLKPICATCNKSMGTKHLEEFKNKYFNIQPEPPIPKIVYVNKFDYDIQKQNNKFNTVSQWIKDIDIKNNTQSRCIINFTNENLILDQCIITTPGIINVFFLKHDTFANVLLTLACSTLHGENLMCNYGMPNIINRINFVKMIIHTIESYRSLIESVNILFNSQ